jgi:ketosteroid isomerase-like protein
MMRKTLSLLSLVSLMSFPSFAQSLQADLDAMVAAERAFSKLSEEKGFKESFLTYIAEDGIMFRPTPVKGKEMLAARPDPPIKLTWQPSHAEIARSGDMGWTTGPWQRQPKGSNVVFYGDFLTVWKKQPDGKWRWVIDAGSSHPKPTAPAGSPPRVPAEKSKGPVAKADTAAETQALLTVDRELGQETANGTSAAYLSRITDDARLMRGGAFPHVGKEAVRAALDNAPAVMTSAPEGGGVSAAGDLGYTYGTAEVKGAKVGYLRIWEKHGIEGKAAWKLRVDWMDDPLPPPAKP